MTTGQIFGFRRIVCGAAILTVSLVPIRVGSAEALAPAVQRNVTDRSTFLVLVPMTGASDTIPSCGTWLRTKASSSTGRRINSPDDLAAEALGDWVLGFVTGMDMASATPLRKTDPDGVLVAMDKKCESDPTLNIMQAAFRVVMDLGGKLGRERSF